MRAKATKAKAAQGMAKRAERLLAGIEGERAQDRVAKLRFPEPAPCGKTPLTARELSKSYGSLEIFTDVDLAIDRGARVVVLGLNGAGKTTLLKLLSGTEAPDTGEVLPGHGLRLGYYAQEHDTLDTDRTVLENMRSSSPDLPEPEARRVLGSFLFTGDVVHQPAGTLSGGEKTRLALATLVVSGANVLLLDEPTNNLDPASRAEVLSALASYKGAVVLVTHDEGAVTALEPEKVLLLPDGVEDQWSDALADLIALACVGPMHPKLMDLPWAVPLERWPTARLVGLPRGISRHVVRFVRPGVTVFAVKEIGRWSAEREYAILRRLERSRVPAVHPIGLVLDRRAPDGTELETALVTQHLDFSLPYRALFSQTLRPETAVRLLDALAVLLVQLHLAGFWWGDCSLSNTLFRRDAGPSRPTSWTPRPTEYHASLSDGQRRSDLDMARTNIIGELMDLQAGELLDTAMDPIDTGDTIAARYNDLWRALTEREVVRVGERFRVDARIRRLNELGFDVAELEVVTELDGDHVQVQPKVVDAGHHARRLLRLTGLDVEENQARRLLNDLDSYRASSGQKDESEELVAHDWLVRIFQPLVRSLPSELRGKLEPAEVFHEVLEHRWFLSEQAGRDVGLRRGPAQLRRPRAPAQARRESAPRPAYAAALGFRHAFG